MKVNWLIYEQPLKALVKFVIKTISFVFVMGLAFAGICAAGLLFCSVMGMWALAVSQTPIWWFPIIALGGIITAVCVFRAMRNTAMSAFCAIVLGIMWPVVVTGMLIWISLFSIGTGIDRLKEWCNYDE